ncbi:DUF4124 domain-containing protein [Pseudomarimonas arenosa]|uniref:DUF4124 domain-containing protein n=1 Tax=Pseudomarimonas arenosa TaxID=2774145 RepID=A0AAW3ZPD3_9GAMM|nr:DUF4124 domain-containing protein [Pseudomarimonas arenosa]MBD8527022.1 DUF4124 domain-containing protein [Pseudomarimonas arenosa]
MKASILTLAVTLALAGVSADVHAQKLYRWTDKDGKVHYSDHVPPDAVENARDELNKSGLKVGEVDRALTPAELEAQRKQLEAEALAAKQQAEKEQADSVLLSSYGSVEQLDKAYAERFALIDQSIESAQIGINSQEKSLAELLQHAASLERQGKPVPVTIQNSIQLAKTQVGQQREFLQKRVDEKALLATEFEATKQRYVALLESRAE